MALLNEVFGVTSTPVKSYLERDSVDAHFRAALLTDKHIVVYGASKQGKTALVSRYLPYNDNIVVRLSSGSTTEDIYKSILRQSNVELVESIDQEDSHKISGGLKSKILAKIPFIGSTDIEASANAESASKTITKYKSISINISLPQDVSEAINIAGMRKRIILENFHYLDVEVQRRIAFDLRNFQEMGIYFVILGVWRQKDKLRTYCPDLTDRVDEVAVEPWEETDFEQVAKRGCDELRAHISLKIVEYCVSNSFGSVGVFQELIKETCVSAGLLASADTVFFIDDITHAQEAVRKKSEHYGLSHRQALQMIATGNVTHSTTKELAPLHLPYYLVKSILAAGYDGFEKGLDRSDLTARIKSIHHRPDNVRPGDMTNLLNGLSTLQFKKSINPPLIDYDEDKRRLFAIDSTFFFFLKNCDLIEFSEELPNPLPAL